eukprot:m.28089 g.28089  ORF g.28089 m.28089 type:complete len:758 (-) comp4481_c0_seq1:102-2375(-)
MSSDHTVLRVTLWCAVLWLATSQTEGASSTEQPKMALTPPLGFNTWNKFGCTGISAEVLMSTADDFINLGLDKVGYEYVNSDDCWMQATRADNGAGPQIPNPQKFPNGMRVVADYIHSKGLKMGLYTARANQTCGKFAASCEHELVDIKQWANWTIDYMKDDSCGTCRTTGPHGPVIADYTAMQDAILQVGRPIVLTIEGGPDITQVYTGCCGNARRVGHDIAPEWLSMTSLIDIGSGLWPYAHNGSLGTAGGFWNDLDMLEVGNGEFDADANSLYEAQARSHYSLWCAMKAVMLLGCNLTAAGPKTLDIIRNADAVAINQDPWGRQAQRVKATPASNQSLAAGPHAVGVLKPCQQGLGLQQWKFKSSSTSGSTAALNIAPCNVSDEAQRFTLAHGALQSVLTNQCVDASLPSGTMPFSAPLQPCVANKSSQTAELDATTHHFHVGGSGHCLDCFNNQGPNVFIGGCKVPGQGDANQRFTPYSKGQGMYLSDLTATRGVDTCLTVRAPAMGSALYTEDTTGQAWCLGVGGPQSAFTAIPCNPSDPHFVVPSSTYGWTPVPAPLERQAPCDTQGAECISPPMGSNGTYTIQSDKLSYNGKNILMGYNNDFGASGPVPHSRWLFSGGEKFVLDPTSASGSPIRAVDSVNIIDDDNAGHVTKGGHFCVELNAGSSVEVWAGLLSGPRWVIALFNRSPSPDTISINFAEQLPDLAAAGVSPGTKFRLTDVWTKDQYPAAPSYSTVVGGHDTALLIATPVTV